MVMDFVIATVTDIFSALPEGYLPKWLLFTSALGIFNSIQNLCTDKLTKRVYAGKPSEGEISSRPGTLSHDMVLGMLMLGYSHAD